MSEFERFHMEEAARLKKDCADMGIDWEIECDRILTGVGALPDHDIRCIASAHRTVPPIVVEKKL